MIDITPFWKVRVVYSLFAVYFFPVETSAHDLWPDVFVSISSVVASLARPLAVIFLLMKFRTGLESLLEAIKDRLPSMESLKSPWLEASWSTAAVKVLSEGIKSLGQEQTVGSEPSDELSSQLAKVKPSAGVINAFLEVERQVGKYLKAVGS
ncbi:MULTISPECIES: hypothetical protein [unclassified Arthrobacter]|uniref:hypothetical protein n=1 Tax=Micrococcaceae TaxID=1268 RepID=UPI0014150920|nr:MULTISPECIES: hypothetical protein [unclassified Arthrobacter]